MSKFDDLNKTICVLCATINRLASLVGVGVGVGVVRALVFGLLVVSGVGGVTARFLRARGGVS